MDSAEDFLPFQVGGSSSCGNSFLDIMCQRFRIKTNKEWDARQVKLYIYSLFYYGQIYDALSPWNTEYASNKYIPLNKRRPCVIYPIPRIIVNDSVGMLFGNSHFPVMRCDDEDTENFIQSINRVSNIKNAMMCAAKIGSLGSVCVIAKVLNSKFHFDVLNTLNVFPVFDKLNPHCLESLTEKVKVTGATLINSGEDLEPTDLNKSKIFWMVRKLTKTQEIFYKMAEDKKDWEIGLIEDTEKSSTHNFGFVPAVWIKNLPTVDSEIDGECTFGSVLDMCVETDYQLSQLARLLRYNSDPTLVIKDPSAIDGQILIKGQGALKLGENGDAFLLEMNGQSTKSVIDYVKTLREFAIEATRGNRASPNKMNALHSGKALQMLNSPLISLADELRLSYGNNGLLEIYKLVFAICESNKVEISDIYGCYGDLNKTLNSMILDWPEWYPSTMADNLQESQAIATNMQSGIISRETAISSIAEKYNITDIQKELTDILHDGNYNLSAQRDSGTVASADVDHQED
jgi:hypothetical protein